jgi:hypothetical protein
MAPAQGLINMAPSSKISMFEENSILKEKDGQ